MVLEELVKRLTGDGHLAGIKGDGRWVTLHALPPSQGLLQGIFQIGAQLILYRGSRLQVRLERSGLVGRRTTQSG